MIFFSSDPDFEIFYNEFLAQGLKIDLLITESPKKQGRRLEIKPNAAHEFANEHGLKVRAFKNLEDEAAIEIKKHIGQDKLGFIFAYGKIIPQNIINLFENGILNIHFSLLPEYPGASPIQQALLEDRRETGYTVFEITEDLDRGLLLSQEKIKILPEDDFDSLRDRVIAKATKDIPQLIKQYLNKEIELTRMPQLPTKFTRRLSKKDGELSNKDNAKTAYNKIRAFSRWPKTYFFIDGKRIVVHRAKITGGKLEITHLQVEGKNVVNFEEFKNGYQNLLTKMPHFVKIN